MGYNEGIDKKNVTTLFSFTDGTTHNGTVAESSTSLSIDYNTTWNVSVDVSGLTGEGKYTIQVSDDNVTWYNYAEEFKEVSTEDSVAHDDMEYLLIRVKYEVGSVSAGSVIFKLNNKLS